MSLQKNNYIIISLYLLSTTLYLWTLTPTVYWGDSAEFSTTSFLLDIPHQPGYPLYNLIGKLFTLFPFGDVASRCNFTSVFFASLSSCLIYLIFLELFISLKYKNHLFAVFGTFLYCLSYTFFNQTTFAEVYTLFVFITSILIFLLLRLKNHNNTDIRLFYFFVFLGGISITHHLLILPLGSALLFFVIVNDKLRVELFKKLPLLIFLFILPLTIYLYLPLRSATNPYLDWGNPEIFSQFKHTITLKSPDTQLETLHPFIKEMWLKIKNIHLLSLNFSRVIFFLPLIAGFLVATKIVREGAKKYIFYLMYLFLFFSFVFSYFFLLKYVPFYEKVQGLHNFTFFEILLQEFPLPITVLAPVGMLYLLKRDRNLFLFFIFLFSISTSFIIFRMFPRYRPYDHYRFFIIGNLVLTIFITIGIASLKVVLDRFKNKYLPSLPAVFFISALFFIFLNNYNTVNKRNYYYAEDLIKNINSTIPPHSLTLIDGVDIYFLLYYDFKISRIRDKELVFLHEINTPWYFDKLKRKNFYDVKYFKYSAGEKIKNLVNFNYEKYKLYYVATSSFARGEIEKFCLKPGGIVYLIKRDDNCKHTENDISENKKYIYKIYKYRGIENKTKDRKATGAANLYGVMHQNLARMYLSVNKTESAISELKKSIKLFSQNSNSYEILAGIYYNKGDILSAIKNLEKAIEYDKDNVYLMNRLGMLYIDTGNLDKAEEIYNKCIKVYPEFMEAHYNLGIVYKMQGDVSNAIEQFEIVKRIAPNITASYIALGKIFHEIEDKERAKKEFEEAIKIEPDNTELQKYLGELAKK